MYYGLDNQSTHRSIDLISAILFAHRMFTIQWAFLQKLIITLTVRCNPNLYCIYTILFYMHYLYFSQYLYFENFLVYSFA